jgi:hypothetical protein
MAEPRALLPNREPQGIAVAVGVDLQELLNGA